MTLLRDGPPGRRKNLPALLALLLAVACLLVTAVVIFLPFLPALVGALVLTVVAYPLFQWILEKVGERRRGLASALACMALMVIVFGPLVWLGWRLGRELPGKVQLKDSREWLALRIKSVEKVPLLTQSRWDSFKDSALSVLSPKAGEPDKAGEAGKSGEPGKPGDAVKEDDSKDSLDVEKSIIAALANVIPLAVNTLQHLIAAGFQAVLMILLTLFVLFFFFKDGQPILRAVQQKIPLDRSQQDRVVRAFSQVSRSVIRGILGTAAAQGLIAGIAYAIVGLPAIFLGALTTFCALIPPFGTTIVTVPTIIYLAFLADPTRPWAAGFLLVVAIGISFADNVLRPLLMQGSGLQIHSIWLFLAILGGMNAFGPMGLIYGPLVLVLLGAFLALLVKEEREEAARVQHRRQPEPPPDLGPGAPAVSQPAANPLPSPLGAPILRAEPPAEASS